jgi:transposase
MTMPGIGPIISSAMVVAIGTSDAFAKGRDFAAWLGLVPKQISTGDRTILGKISKRGNRYLRVLFVQAAWVVLIKPTSWERHGLKPWIAAAKKPPVLWRVWRRPQWLKPELQVKVRHLAGCDTLRHATVLGASPPQTGEK